MKRFMKRYYRALFLILVPALICCGVYFTAVNNSYQNYDFIISEDEHYTTTPLATPEPTPYDFSDSGEVLAAEDSEMQETPDNADDTKDDIKSYVYPVSGEMIEDFRADRLEYSETMGDWRAHAAVDFSAFEGEGVCAAEDGVVERIYTDAAYGKTLVLVHSDGIKTIYSPLADDTTPAVGDEVARGEIIGCVGEGCAAEKYDTLHLHFAAEVNGKRINPMELFE